MKAVRKQLSSVLRVTHSYITAHSRTFFNCLLQRQQKENTSAISVVLPEGFHIKPLRPSFSSLWEKWVVFLFPIAHEKKHSNKNEINEKANASLMNTFRDKIMYQYSKAHFHAYAYLLKESERLKSGSQLHHWAVKPGNTMLRKGWFPYPSVSLKGNQLCSTAGTQRVQTTELLCITQGLATHKKQTVPLKHSLMSFKDWYRTPLHFGKSHNSTWCSQDKQSHPSQREAPTSTGI